jgi:hypothetical protein
VDQRKLDPRSRTARGRLILIRTGHHREILEWSSAKYPVLLIVALVARPEYHARLLPDFERFLNMLGLGAASSTRPPDYPSLFECESPVPLRRPTRVGPGPAAPAPSSDGDTPPP